MRLLRFAFILAVGLAPLALEAQTGQRGAPPPPAPPPGAQPPPGTQPAPPGQRGGGRGRGAVQVMTLTSTAWADGGTIPKKHTQAGEEVSPPFAWTNVPETAASFVLVAHDLDAVVGTDDVLHWLLWNIPAATRSLAEHVPVGSQLPDGTRQISITGPSYRGPGAAASGPAHHYVFELYALDSMLDVAAVGASPAQTRAAVLAGMAGHMRGKAVYVGLFKRTE
jgi:Raf kinase inhibitor-like YbhB/YbcL family protein